MLFLYTFHHPSIDSNQSTRPTPTFSTKTQTPSPLNTNQAASPPSIQQTMKTQITLAAVATLGCASAFLVGTPLAAPKAKVCSSTTRMAVTLPPLPCKSVPQ